MSKRREGWGGTFRPNEKIMHYYRGGESVCGLVAFYKGPLEPNGTDAPPSPNDCPDCRKALSRRAA